MSTMRITAPVPGINGTGVGGLTFVDSVAETDNQAIIDYCTSAGYAVEPAASSAPEGAPSKDWTVAQLRAWASEHDVKLGKAKSKDEILDALANPTTDNLPPTTPSTGESGEGGSTSSAPTNGDQPDQD